MKIKRVIAIAGTPDAKGYIFTEECLRKLARENPDITYNHATETATRETEVHPEVALEMIGDRIVGASFVTKSAVVKSCSTK